MGKRELVALPNLSSWCLMMVEWLFLAVPWGCLWFVIMVFPDHTHLLIFGSTKCMVLEEMLFQEFQESCHGDHVAMVSKY